MFWKYWARNKIKSWIIPHKAVESFGWTFLDGFDVLKLYLHRLQAKVAKVRGPHFWKKSIYRGGMLVGKKVLQWNITLSLRSIKTIQKLYSHLFVLNKCACLRPQFSKYFCDSLNWNDNFSKPHCLMWSKSFTSWAFVKGIVPHFLKYNCLLSGQMSVQ